MAEPVALSAEWNMADAGTEEFEPWKPAVGNMLAGELGDIRVLNSKYGEGEEKLWLIIKGEDGNTYSWIPPTQAQREVLDRLRMGVCGVGKPIGAKFVEERKTRSGGLLKVFRIWPEIPMEMRKQKADAAVQRFTPPAGEPEKTTVEKFDSLDVSKV